MSALSDLTRPPRAEPLATLLAWEAAVRRQASVPELGWFLANEIGALVACDQAFVLRRPLVGDGWRIEAASGVDAVERHAPLVRAIMGAER